MGLPRYAHAAAAVVFAVIALAFDGIAKADTESRGDSHSWVAFIADTNANGNNVPRFIVFSDGQVIWRQRPATRNAGAESAREWLTGVASPDLMSKFRINIEPSAFFTIPIPSTDTAAQSGKSNRVTSIGVQFGQKERILSVVDLKRSAAQSSITPFVSTVMAVRDAIMALKPMASSVYTPKEIVVSLRPAPAGVTPVAWPVTVLPSTSATTTYQGSDAGAITGRLADNSYVTIAGTVYRAVWAPYFELPAAP